MTRFSRVALLCAAALSAAPAFAQDGAGGGGTLGTGAQRQRPDEPSTTAADDVVVTAQKRAQTLIEVPQSVSVVSGAALETQQANSFEDYLKLVPGLQLNQSTQGAGRLVLRGINTGGVASTVAVYVDDTPFGSSSGLANGATLAGDFDTFDVARVEVLRGPQGTLYGANSLGGLLKFVTNEPDTDKVEARGRASVEDVRGGKVGYSGNAVVNLPLGDKLALRASGYYRRLGGFIDSIGTATTFATPTEADPAATATLASDAKKDINAVDSYGGRASLLAKPTDGFTVRLTAVLQNIDTDAPNIVESDPVTLNRLYGRLSQSRFVPAFTNTAYRLYNGTADLDLGFATATSVTSYGTLRQRSRGDITAYLNGALGGALGTPAFGLAATTRQHKFTQEVRLANNEGRVFTWLVGGYYTRETGRLNQAYQAYTPGTATQIAGLPVLGVVRLPSRYTEYAGFANGTLYLGSRLDVTLGGRWSHNRQRASQTTDGALAGGELIAIPTTRSSDDVFTYSAAPRFNINTHASIYARIAKGYRPGGPNVVPPGSVDASQRTFGSDTVTSYEVGFKGETADRSFSLEVTGFHIDWRKIQLLTFVETFGINQNGGRAVSDGVELTATVKPTDGLNVSLNGAYTKARLRDDTGVLVGGLDGDRLPYSPKLSVGVDGSYQWRLAGETQAYLGASLRALSRQSGDYDYIFRTTYGRQRQIPAYEVVDLRAGLEFGRFGLEVYAKNLTDRAGRTSAAATFPTPSLYPNGALATGVIRPRTLGVSLTAGF